MLAAIDLTAFSAGVADVTTALTGTVGPALIGLSVAVLGIMLAISWIRRIRSVV